jgi:hypothetical protein
MSSLVNHTSWTALESFQPRTDRWILTLVLAVVALVNGGCLMGLPLLAGGVRGMLGPGLGPGGASESHSLYTPAIKLSESPTTIEAKARLEPFINKMPAHDTASKRGTEEVTSPESVEGDLLELIREAIGTDLRVNLVFSSVRIHLDHPELLIRGVIYEFAESHSRPWWARLPLVGLLPTARERVEGGVKLDLVVATPTGHVVGTYQGRSVFPDPTKPDPAPGEMRRPRGTHLNRAFTEAMRQIREQMLADRLLIGGQWRQVSQP